MGRLSLMAIILVFALMIALPVSVFSATLCVNTGGTGGCYGTIQEAVNAATAGDTINVAAGRYNENVTIGTALTIQGATGQDCRLSPNPVLCYRTGGTTLLDPATVILDAYVGCRGDEGFDISADNVTIKNMTVRHACNYNIMSTGNNTALNNVRVISGGSGGVHFSLDGSSILNSFIAGNSGMAVLSSNYGSSIQGSQIINNAMGVYIYADEDSSTIKNNTISVEGISIDLSCLHMEGSSNSVITGNTVSNCFGAGIADIGGYNDLISGNTVRSVHGFPLFFNAPEASEGSQGIESLENVIRQDGFFEGWGIGILAEGTAIAVSSNTVQNSVIGILGEGSGNSFTGNTVRSSGFIGFYIMDDTPTVTGNTAEDLDMSLEGTYGFAVFGSGGSVAGNRASYANYGFYMELNGATISGNTAERNSYAGFEISGEDNTIQNNTARYNGSAFDTSGFDLYVGGSTPISGNLAEYNAGRGFDVYSYGTSTLTSNTARNNFRTGFLLSSGDGGTISSFGTNTALNNAGEGIANMGSLGAMSGNTATGNRTDICNDGTITTFGVNTFVTGGPTTPCELEGSE
jgi:parallel beta-helix repeat protein